MQKKKKSGSSEELHQYPKDVLAFSTAEVEVENCASWQLNTMP